MTLRFWFRHVVRVIAAFVLWYVSPTPALCQSAPHVVISEIYGGGGNSGALYTHDFIEIHNPTGSDVVMNDWSVQYQGGGGTGVFTSVAGFSGIIRSHGFFLIQANPGSGGTVPLP
ncbi:MAG TPA: lamin tail domain-containing protein, partial [Bacteroidota bacterium]|nr:lamin tail domain-containing protein [Bacteroidota bacterium]